MCIVFEYKKGVKDTILLLLHNYITSYINLKNKNTAYLHEYISHYVMTITSARA